MLLSLHELLLQCRTSTPAAGEDQRRCKQHLRPQPPLHLNLPPALVADGAVAAAAAAVAAAAAASAAPVAAGVAADGSQEQGPTNCSTRRESPASPKASRATTVATYEYTPQQRLGALFKALLMACQ